MRPSRIQLQHPDVVYVLAFGAGDVGHVEIGCYILIDAGIYSVVIADVTICSACDVGVAVGIGCDGRAIREGGIGTRRTDHGRVGQGCIARGGGRYLGCKGVLKTGADILLRETPPDRAAGNRETALGVVVALHIVGSGDIGIALAVDSNRGDRVKVPSTNKRGVNQTVAVLREFKDRSHGNKVTAHVSGSRYRGLEGLQRGERGVVRLSSNECVPGGVDRNRCKSSSIRRSRAVSGDICRVDDPGSGGIQSSDESRRDAIGVVVRRGSALIRRA